MNFFLRRYEQLGESFDPLDFQLRRSLRVNTLKISECDLVKRLKAKGVKLEKIPFLKDGYWYESEFSLGSTNEYLQGYYYLQEAASQLSVQVLNPKSGEYVLDMSAAPGGKTSQIASFMENKGLIVAADANVLRLDSLSNNLERLGVKIALIYKKDTRYIDDFGLKFDKILLDAPCSGNFAEDKDWFESREINGVIKCSGVQRELLSAAIKVLKKNGVLVYSTCTLEPEENELNVQWLLDTYPDMKLELADISIGDSGLTSVFGKSLSSEIKNCKRLWPHKHGTQGFFIARSRKV